MTVRNIQGLRDSFDMIEGQEDFNSYTSYLLNSLMDDVEQSMQSLMSYAVDLEDKVLSLERTQKIDAECIALLDARCEELQGQLDRMKARKAWEEMAGWDY